MIFSSKKHTNIAALLSTSLVLAACNSSGTNTTVDNALDVQPAVQQNNVQVAQSPDGRPLRDEVQDPRAFCPKIVLRSGTETYNVFAEDVKEEDAGSSAQLRYRASITEHVRECNSAGQFLNIDVGVRGRFLSGPKGDTGSFVLPLRIAAVRGEEVLYSQLHQIPVEILPGRTNGAFSYVDKQLSILKPESPNVRIFVGFDEGAKPEVSN